MGVFILILWLVQATDYRKLNEPPRPRLQRNGTIYLMARPPLLCYNERVTFPLPDRVAEPGGSGIHGQRTTIRENLAILIEFLVEYRHHTGRLDDLERVTRHQHRVRHAVR